MANDSRYHAPENDRSLASLLQETRDDLKQFVQTRYEMLLIEVNEKLAAWKMFIPMLLAALVIAGAAFLTLTFAFVAALRPLFDQAHGWAIAALIVGGAYSVMAAIIGWLGYREITAAGLRPERTLRVLKQDQVWLQNEARRA